MNICEVYLDDVIVYARTEEELLSRVRQVKSLREIQREGIDTQP